MKNVKILQKEISDIKWELTNSVLSTEERVEKKILLQRLEYQVGVLMEEHVWAEEVGKNKTISFTYTYAYLSLHYAFKKF